MRRALRPLSILLKRWAGPLLAVALLGATSVPAVAESGRAVIVVLRDGADSHGVAAEHARAHGAQVTHVYTAALRGYAARVTDRGLAAIAADRRVAYYVDDEPVSISDTVPTGVNRIDADVSSTLAGNGAGAVNVGVAVLDTGIAAHPELSIAGGVACIGGTPNDGNGHGTHVAGIIAAKDDGVGIVGVAPGAPLYRVKVLSDAGSGTFSTVICGVDWVTANAAALGIKVANMSLGGTGRDRGNCGNGRDALHLAICNSVARGVTYVVAAGNSNQDLKNSVPAAYNEVLTVTAIADFNGLPGGGAAATCRADVDDTAADFSNFTQIGSGDVSHVIAAPGVCITSTWLNSGYNTISGTSMASPHAAGTAALCIGSGACAGLTPAQIVQKLRGDGAARPASYGFKGDPNSPIGNRYYGHLVYAGGY